MAERLFRAHFSDGPHIGDSATLTRLAAEVGVTPGHVPSREVRARLDRVRRLGITGVPVFLIENCPRSPGPGPRPHCRRPCDRPPARRENSVTADPLRPAVVVGSVRDGRFGPTVAAGSPVRPQPARTSTSM
ncbi:hypothetical protein ACGFI3_26690 [Nonomuraea wenchangensis]|uniref:hypothetical protein n=1 Tax=Nonomuraea wenchangensis TaxID=568860 RepID=UPI0037219E54